MYQERCLIPTFLIWVICIIIFCSNFSSKTLVWDDHPNYESDCIGVGTPAVIYGRASNFSTPEDVKPHSANIAGLTCTSQDTCGKDYTVDELPSIFYAVVEVCEEYRCGKISIRCGAANIWEYLTTGIPPEFFWAPLIFIILAPFIGCIVGCLVMRVCSRKTITKYDLSSSKMQHR